MAGRTITQPAENSGVISSVIRNQLQILEDEITLIQPGGSDTYVQFNSGGTGFGGSSYFTWNDTTKVLATRGTVSFANSTNSLTLSTAYNTGFSPNGLVTLQADGNLQLTSSGGNDVIIGSGAISTTATKGFIQIPSTAGTPTGVPGNTSTGTPMIWDSTNNILYVYSGGSWVSTAGTSSGANAALSNLTGVAINTTLLPGTDDGAALGSTTKNFSDLFLASGAVINFANSNVVLTHSSGILTMGTGEMRITTPGTNSASVVTVGGSQSLTGKTYNGLTISTSTGTLTITNLKTLSVSNTLTFTGTDGSSVAFGAGGTVLYTTSTIPLTVGTTTITSGTTTRILYNNAGVLGEYTVTGSGTTAVLSTTPTFTTSIITPIVQGGTGTTGTQLTLKTTSGNGTTDQMVFVGGNNGATTFATLKANSLDLGTSAALTTGTIELGAASDTTLSRSSAGVLAVEGVVIPSISSTDTLTNKRITPRVSTTTSSATPTINTDNVDMYGLTAQAVDITSFTTNLSGTPTDGQKLWIYIVGTAARAITWGTSFESSTVTLPTTTVTTNRLDVGFVWNAATSKWRCVATC